MIIVDNNLSSKIPLKLQSIFPSMIHVIDLGLEASSDAVIWQKAKDAEAAILTKDTDFYHLLNNYGFPPKVIWLRIGNASTTFIVDALINHEDIIKTFLMSDFFGLLEIN